MYILKELLYFQNIGIWKEKYELLNDTVSFLIATCEDSIGGQLKQEFLSIKNMWETIFSVNKIMKHTFQII